jgi:hypothetical protein
VPQERRELLRANQRDGYALLMKAAADAIIELAHDRRFVGLGRSRGPSAFGGYDEKEQIMMGSRPAALRDSGASTSRQRSMPRVPEHPSIGVRVRWDRGPPAGP